MAQFRPQPTNDTSGEHAVESGQEMERCWQIIERTKVAMLVTRDGDQLHARPMGVEADRKQNALWFIIARSSHKDEQVENDNQVCVVVEDAEEGIYLSVAGRGEVIADRASIKAHWRKEADHFFKGGADNPDACLLKVTPEGSKLWDTPPIDEAERNLKRADKSVSPQSKTLH
jgi:general stress protein 26